MRGAKGLLISITGGRDMTLFEVDEAASRVREEVEADANIIFGATFDESLEGLVRVSVVATGIEQERAQEPVAAPAAGMAELTRRLKSVGAISPAAQPAQAPREAVPAYALQGFEEEIAHGLPQPAKAARPAAEAPAARPVQPLRQAADPAVKIGPFRPDPSLIAMRPADGEAEQARANEAARPPAHFIPPAAERPPEAQPRMPRVEDFPAVAQRQLRAQGAAPQEEERRPRGLLARLAQGLARREEDFADPPPRPRDPIRAIAAEAEPRVVAAQPAPQPQPQLQPAAATAVEFTRQAQPRRTAEAAGAAGNLDGRGRIAQAEPARDDHLEIPAFLRRQSS
jgi:cell division protein FtsZ